MKELDNGNKEDGFTAPEGYFENLEERLLNRIESVSEQIDVPKDEGFKVPEDYFETLQKSIIQKLPVTETKVVQLKSYRKFYFAAASIIVLIVTVIGLNRQTEKPLTFQDIASSDIDAYFEKNGVGLTSFEIAEVIPLEDVEIDDLVQEHIQEENIVDYIDENIDDFDELNLEDDESY